MFLDSFLVESETPDSPLAPPDVEWRPSSPSVVSVGASIEPQQLTAVQIPERDDIYGASSDGTLGVIGSEPSFSPYPITPWRTSTPSLQPIAPDPLFVAGLTSATAPQGKKSILVPLLVAAALLILFSGNR